MPIDSLCAGCGKTLRVNDEFVGRKAMCPICGLVYVVGGVASGQPQSTAPIDPRVGETTYAPAVESRVPAKSDLSDSWSTLETDRPLDNPMAHPIAQPIAAPESAPLDVSILSPKTVIKYFVRTPDGKVYGPSDAATVLEWINQGRLDDSCHIRDEASEQWLGIAAWRFQTRKLQNPLTSPLDPSANPFGAAPISTVQSAGYSKSSNGIVVLVLGLVSWIICPTFFGAWICSIAAIVLASNELGKIRSGQTTDKDKTLVLIGMWLGIANLVAWALMVFGIIVISILSP